MPTTTKRSLRINSLKLFIDTNIFVALNDKDDPTHKRALSLSGKIQDLNCLSFTSSDVIGETLTVISKKIGKETARKFWEEYKKSGIYEIFITEELHQEARVLFNKVNHKNVSFIDCSSVVAMNSQNIKTIFSFDQDFKSLGVSLFE